MTRDITDSSTPSISDITKLPFVFVSWSREILRKGHGKSIDPKDLYAHIPSLDSTEVSHSLLGYWECELKRSQPNVLHMIFKAYGTSFVPICILYSLLEISLQ